MLYAPLCDQMIATEVLPLEFLSKLISAQSVSPHDAHLQPLIVSYLKDNLKKHSLTKKVNLSYDLYSRNRTTNSHITLSPKERTSDHHIGFIGHTDVVPADRKSWNSDPFLLSERQDKLFARGLVDMKGAIFCYLEALIRFLKSHPLQCNIHLFLTSDEEGDGLDGIEYLFQQLDLKNFSYCLIGEPTSSQSIGDTLKIGRRGSLHGNILIQGQSYHVAYAGKNHPIACLATLLNSLNLIRFDDQEMAYFPATSLEVTNITCDKTVENVIPSKMSLRFNIRYNPSLSPSKIQSLVENILKVSTSNLMSKIDWRFGAQPWLSSLSEEKLKILFPDKCYKFSCCGGLSDGWKAYKHGIKNLFELGLRNQSAHQHDEWTTVNDLCELSNLYETMLIQTPIFLKKFSKDNTVMA